MSITIAGEHAASGLHFPIHLEGKEQFVHAQDQQVVTKRSPRIVTECLLTRSMLTKMYMVFTVAFEQQLFYLSENMKFNMILSLQ